jgi:hypothetical protein
VISFWRLSRRKGTDDGRIGLHKENGHNGTGCLSPVWIQDGWGGYRVYRSRMTLKTGSFLISAMVSQILVASVA